MDNRADPALQTQEAARRQLYQRQKQLLETFLANGAITPAQYRKSLGDLTEKMGMTAAQ